jgi:hypothetical protein
MTTTLISCDASLQIGSAVVVATAVQALSTVNSLIPFLPDLFFLQNDILKYCLT